MHPRPAPQLSFGPTQLKDVTSPVHLRLQTDTRRLLRPAVAGIGLFPGDGRMKWRLLQNSPRLALMFALCSSGFFYPGARADDVHDVVYVLSNEQDGNQL